MAPGVTSLYRGLDTSVTPPRPVAVRLVPRESRAQFMVSEGNVIATLHRNPHPNILPVLACLDEVTADYDGCVVYQSFTTDLHSVMRSYRRGLTEGSASSIFQQLVSALDHCHSLGVVLGDLKMARVVLCNDVVMLGDFTSAQLIKDPNGMASIRKGSPAYVAPEVLTSHQCDVRLAEMWSLGVCLFVLLTCGYPFLASTPQALFDKIKDDALSYQTPAWVSPPAKTLLARLLTRNLSRRATAAQLLSDPWLCAPTQAGPVAVEPRPESPMQPQVAGKRKARQSSYDSADHADDLDQCVP